jgi:hypothetical protein
VDILYRKYDMRIETVRGRQIVCGHIYPKEELAVGQYWAQADGADRLVVIRAIEGDQVLYGDVGNDTTYQKDWFNFQCRYCLIV